MKSDRLSFNIAIAKDTLRRCWPLWAAYLVYLIITLPVSILSYIRMNTWVEDITWLTGDLNSRVMTLGIHQAEAAIVIGMLTVMVLFGYLYNSPVFLWLFLLLCDADREPDRPAGSLCGAEPHRFCTGKLCKQLCIHIGIRDAG